MAFRKVDDVDGECVVDVPLYCNLLLLPSSGFSFYCFYREETRTILASAQRRGPSCESYEEFRSTQMCFVGDVRVGDDIFFFQVPDSAPMRAYELTLTSMRHSSLLTMALTHT